MHLLRFPLEVMAWVVRLALKLVGLALGLMLLVVILGFVLVAVIWRLISGQGPNINVRTHFSHVRTVTDFGQNLMRQRQSGPATGRPLAAPDVQDVQARDLPPERH